MSAAQIRAIGVAAVAAMTVANRKERLAGSFLTTAADPRHDGWAHRIADEVALEARAAHLEARKLWAEQAAAVAVSS